MHRRVNITLPEETIRLIDRAADRGNRSVDSVILLNQIRSVDTSRLVRRLGVLRAETVREVDRALLLSLGLVEL